MFIIKGNSQKELSKDELNSLLGKYDEVIVDFGAGDGRFVYKTALNNPKSLVIGIEPNKSQLEIYSKKSQRKKLENVLFVVGSVEIPPKELFGHVDAIYINFPWGSLLKEVITPSKSTLETFCELLKTNGKLNIILGYDKDFEPSETKRLELPEISEKYLENNLIPLYKNAGFELLTMRVLDKIQLKSIESTWGKKLAFGNDRNIMGISFIKK